MDEAERLEIAAAFGAAMGDGWRTIGHGADRHGSWEWVSYRMSAGLDRYVTLSLMPSDVHPDFGERWCTEVSYGADAGHRYTRRTILTGGGPRSDAVDMGVEWLPAARLRAEALTVADLDVAKPDLRLPARS